MNFIEQLDLNFKLENDLKQELDGYEICITPSSIIEYYNHIF